MIYLKEPGTNKIVKFQDELSIGMGFASWNKATENEISIYELEEAKLIKIAQCKLYLLNTDKYYIEASDKGLSSYEQKATRQAARDAIPLIKDCATLEELNNINTNF